MFARRYRIPIVLVALLSCARFSSAADDRAANLTPLANVDENLFVLRALAREMNLWPKDPLDAKVALKFCEEGRLRAKYLKAVAADRALDPRVAGMCVDFLMLIDDYESTLAELGKINEEARKQAFEDALNTFVIGAAKSMKKGAEAEMAGKSEAQINAAVAKGLIDDGLKVYIQHSRARDAQTQRSAAQEQERFSKVIDFFQKRNKATVMALTERFGWAAGEAGYDLAPVVPLGDLIKRRPRDPFPRLALAAEGIDNKTSADEMMRRARQCVRAARLVPGDVAYDIYRIECMVKATEYACTSAEMGVNASYQNAPTPNSQDAIFIVRAMSKLDPQDQSGWVHMELFRALISAGRFDDAAAAAQPLLESKWSKGLAFSVRYARLMGTLGQVEQCERWLRWAYKLGFWDLNLVKDSHDFDSLRTQRPAAYAELTTIKGSTVIYFGVLNDDVLVKNRSPFPLTNLKMKFTAINGGKVWKEERTLAYVAAESEETLADVFSIPGSRIDVWRYTLECDQGKLASKDD